MNPQHGFTKLLVLSLFGAGLVACGSADPAPPSEIDRAAAEEELAQVTAALGEPTCGSTAPDATMANAVYGHVTSPTATYDHPTCRNAFVIEMNEQGDKGERSVSRWWISPADKYAIRFDSTNSAGVANRAVVTEVTR